MSLAQAEYKRLRSLIGGRHPYGDCQLVALMIARAIGGDIIEGDVNFESRNQIWHYWALSQDGDMYDPLADAWADVPCVYTPQRSVREEEVLGELRVFVDSIDYIPPHYENPLFPLRYVLAKELIGVNIPNIENLVL